MCRVMTVFCMFFVAITAAPPATVAASLESILPGSQIRMNATMGAERRLDVWNLDKSGKVSGTSRRERAVPGGTPGKSGQVSGRWKVENGKLCVEGEGFELPGRNCYRLTEATSTRRAAKEFNAVNERNGQRWQLFVYSR